MLKDETMSYFIFKRDSLRIGIKLIVVAVPLFIFDQIYKSSDAKNFANSLIGNTSVAESLKKNVEKIMRSTPKE